MLFDKNGKRLHPIDLISASITQEMNGEYSCEITSLDPIEGEQIIALEDADGTEQMFRLSEPIRSLEVYTAKGWHISQDLAHDMIVNRAWLTQTGASAWPELLKAGMENKKFSGRCDITNVRPLRIVRRSVLEAMIGDQDNSFLSRFGGEIRRDNYTIDCLKRIGSDKGFQLKLGRDIVGITVRRDFTGVVNRIIPTYLNESGAAVLLPETYVDSPTANETAVTHAKAIHYGDIWVGRTDSEDENPQYPTDESAQDEVRNRIAEMWVQGADKHSVTVEVDFVALKDTEEYKEFANLESVAFGDTVTIDLDNEYFKERLLMYEWDVLEKEYLRTVLGKPHNTFTAMANSIEDRIVSEQDYIYQTRRLPALVEATVELNQHVANAMGFFTTKVTNPDGSEQVYIHDKPTLEESSYIEFYPSPGTRVFTDNGWNGGNPEWESGTMGNSAVLERLLVGRITSDHIQSGAISTEIITVREGETLTDRLFQTDREIQDLQESDQILNQQITEYKAGGSNLIMNSDFGSADHPSDIWWTIQDDVTWNLIDARFDTWGDLAEQTWGAVEEEYDW